MINNLDTHGNIAGVLEHNQIPMETRSQAFSPWALCMICDHIPIEMFSIPKGQGYDAPTSHQSCNSFTCGKYFFMAATIFITGIALH